jgi:glycosyltransferase involved in cell wall biosynthesis/GT2 family glycosyltransferase
MTPRVSVVISTLNRADSLRRTLLSLRQLDYPELEVVVVVGPSTDDTNAVVAEFGDEIKVGRSDEPNLSASRNIGIRISSGELVAFIDDDSVPDPWWLNDIVPAFRDSEVAAAGGPVYDFDGASLFSRYSLVDIHGDTMIWRDGPNPSRALAAPFSNLVLYPIGTNAVFRRSALVALGGYDEELGHYFDDADIGRRVVDSGWVVEACERGFVYHFRLPSATRTEQRVTRDLYPYLRSRAYFGLRHGRPRVGLADVVRRYEQTVEHFREERRWCKERGLLEAADLEDFERDAIRAADDGLESALREPRLREPSWFDGSGSAFRAYRRPLPERRLHVCIVTQEYLPKQLNGIGRLSHELGMALAQRGHVVRILTQAEEHDAVEFENGVWVHRIVPEPTTPPVGLEGPARIWDFSAGVLRELCRMDKEHPVDIVQMPNWNSEGIAILEDGGFTTVLGLHTPLETIARIDPRVDPENLELRQLLALERRCYDQATGYLACGPASLHQVEKEYGIELQRDLVRFVPFGISDRRSSRPLTVPERVNVLFVGRLEARKGIDTLLEAATSLLTEMTDVVFTIVGDDSIPSGSGVTYRKEFEQATDASLRDGRVFFHGVVSDEELDRYYAGCDIFVAPSRSESFGLILLEAMREGKPVVAGDAGGMREVIEREGNGVLVPPGDAKALAHTLRRLVESRSLRERFGRRSRELFEERFTAARMAESYERFCMNLLETRV